MSPMTRAPYFGAVKKYLTQLSNQIVARLRKLAAEGQTEGLIFC